MADSGIEHVHLAALEGHGALKAPVLSHTEAIDETSPMMDRVLESRVEAYLLRVRESVRRACVPPRTFSRSPRAEVWGLAHLATSTCHRLHTAMRPNCRAAGDVDLMKVSQLQASGEHAEAHR